MNSFVSAKVNIKKFLILLCLLMSSCLQTRNDVKEAETKQVMQKQVVDLQRTSADVNSKFSDVEEQLRHFNGRLETVESKITRNDSDSVRVLKNHTDNIQDTNKKMLIYQEALAKLESQLQQNTAEIASLKLELAKNASGKNSRDSKEGKRDALSTAQDLFKQKDWQNAIIEFQKYRDKNPKGKYISEATYKIGVCFQELSMREDAKTFYQEVIASYPNSEEAKKAKSRLKVLK